MCKPLNKHLWYTLALLIRASDREVRVLHKTWLMLTLMIFFSASSVGFAQPAWLTRDDEQLYMPLVYAPPMQAAPSGWLAYVNAYRSGAGLPPVAENPIWSEGNRLHARYMVKNDVIEHSEDASNPWYTLEGLSAAQSSNLAANFDVNTPDEWAIDSFMQAPFHAIGILDPRLAQVGYGSYREAGGTLAMGAGLDVLRGLGDLPAAAVFPIIWPGDGATVPLGRHWGEYPDPLSSCPGYRAPSGLPVILQLGTGDTTPNVTLHSLEGPGGALEHCVFDETSYVNTDGAGQSLGRNILDSRDAIVLIPRAPLVPGETYAVSITANGRVYSWSFSVSAGAR